jgi:hypothetical protein
MASGTGNRQRTKQCLVRFTEQEFAEIIEKADRAGSPAAAFLRAAALGSPGPRARRRPPADHVALRQILGHCGRIGNNINQIAKRLNTGGDADIAELREALAACLDIRTAILAALAMKPHEAAADDHQGQQPRRT